MHIRTYPLRIDEDISMVLLEAKISSKGNSYSILDLSQGEKFMAVDFGAVRGYVRVINRVGRIGYVQLERVGRVVKATKTEEYEFIDNIMSHIESTNNGNIDKSSLKLLRDLYKLRYIIGTYGTNWCEKVSIKGTKFIRIPKTPSETMYDVTEAGGDIGMDGDFIRNPYTRSGSADTDVSKDTLLLNFNDEELLENRSDWSIKPERSDAIEDLTIAYNVNHSSCQAVGDYRQSDGCHMTLQKMKKKRGKKGNRKATRPKKETHESTDPGTDVNKPSDREDAVQPDLTDGTGRDRGSVERVQDITKASGDSSSLEKICSRLQKTLLREHDCNGCGSSVVLLQRKQRGDCGIEKPTVSVTKQNNDSNKTSPGRMASVDSFVDVAESLFVSTIKSVSTKLKQKNDEFIVRFFTKLGQFIPTVDKRCYQQTFAEYGQTIARNMAEYYVVENRCEARCRLMSLMKDLSSRDCDFKTDLCRTNLPWVFIDHTRGDVAGISEEERIGAIETITTLLSPPRAQLFLMDYFDEITLRILLLAIAGSADSSNISRSRSKLVEACIDLLVTLTRYSKFSVMMATEIGEHRCADALLSVLLRKIFMMCGERSVFGSAAVLLKQILELSSCGRFTILSCQLEDAFEVIGNYIVTTPIMHKLCLSWCLDTLILILKSPYFQGSSRHWTYADNFVEHLEASEEVLSSGEREYLKSLKVLVNNKKSATEPPKESPQEPKAVKSDSVVHKSRPRRPEGFKTSGDHYEPMCFCISPKMHRIVHQSQTNIRNDRRSVSSTAIGRS